MPWGAGLVDVLDGYVHALRPGLLGPSALCGAGPIVVELIGRFESADALACPRCTARVEVVPDLPVAPARQTA